MSEKSILSTFIESISILVIESFSVASVETWLDTWLILLRDIFESEGLIDVKSK